MPLRNQKNDDESKEHPTEHEMARRACQMDQYVDQSDHAILLGDQALSTAGVVEKNDVQTGVAPRMRGYQAAPAQEN